MAQGQDIRRKIRSVQSTQKITRAMQMVAAAKMRKAHERLYAARPYAERMAAVMGHFRAAHPEYRHPFWMVRPVARAGLLVISSDRGLAGALNAGVFRLAVGTLKGWQEAGIASQIGVYGGKGASYFRRLQAPVTAQMAPLGDAPTMAAILGVVKAMTDAYRNHAVDRVALVYNRFHGTLSQIAVVEDLLPLPVSDDLRQGRRWDYLYEPEAREVIEAAMSRYVETRVYAAILENLASEQAARMMAMRAATDNAGRLIVDLRLAYNKARQAAITQELAEIVGGAAAV
ncbi:MAG: F0F1 ATP synthase subunit gamma [Acidiferrobacter sp.]